MSVAGDYAIRLDQAEKTITELRAENERLMTRQNDLEVRISGLAAENERLTQQIIEQRHAIENSWYMDCEKNDIIERLRALLADCQSHMCARTIVEPQYWELRDRLIDGILAELEKK